MKLKHLMMVSLILLILTIGAVSASEDLEALAVDDVGDELAVDDSADEEIVEASLDDGEILEADESGEVLGDPTAADFHFDIKNEASINDPDATVISFDWPSELPAPSVVSIRVIGGIEVQYGKFGKTGEKVTLKDLGITSTGKYSFNIYLGDDNYLTGGTINVVEKLSNSNSQQTQSQDASNNVKLTLKKVAVKKSAKKLVLQATVKVNDKAKKGLKVKFKFDKKTYTAKTNAKGVAKVTIKKSVLKKLKVGKKLTYQASYGSNVKKVTVKVRK
jgi:hypothetical protein